MNWRGKINIPERVIFKTIGKNKVAQKVIKEQVGIEATISESGIQNFLVIRTSLPAPLNEILLSKTKTVSGARPNDLVLSPKSRILANTDYSKLAFKWIPTNKLVELFDTPEKIVNEWTGKFVLSNNSDNQGLRKPQIGSCIQSLHIFTTIPKRSPQQLYSLRVLEKQKR